MNNIQIIGWLLALAASAIVSWLFVWLWTQEKHVKRNARTSLYMECWKDLGREPSQVEWENWFRRRILRETLY